MASLPSARRILLYVVLAGISIAVMEGVAFTTLAVASRVLTDPPRRTASILRDQSRAVRALITPDPKRRHELDPVLGWRYRSDFGPPTDHINREGVRADREYALHPPSGVLRVEAFGDSFVYGNEVDLQESWSARVEQQFPEVEMMNFGVGGYGVDQAYLRYEREGMRYAPRVVIMGFVADDLRRLVNVYRRFISSNELPLVKPRFVLRAADSLALLPDPLPDSASYQRLLADPRAIVTLGRHDQWYSSEVYQNPLYDYSATVRLAVTAWRAAKRGFLDPDRLTIRGTFNPDASAFRIQVKLFEAFAGDVRRAGARPLVVLFPDQESLLDRKRGRPLIYSSLAQALRTQGIEYIDLASAFPPQAERPEIASWFNPGGHYSPKGNAIVAAALGSMLTAASSRNLPAQMSGNVAEGRPR